MKKILLLLFVVSGCNRGQQNTSDYPENKIADSIPVKDNVSVDEQVRDTTLLQATPQSNDRFKNVAVQKISTDSAKVTGSARIFEATLSYAIYEKGKQVYEGFHTTSAGAPEWGNFDFNIALPSSSGQSGTYLIVFESSAKDGSRLGILKFPL